MIRQEIESRPKEIKYLILKAFLEHLRGRKDPKFLEKTMMESRLPSSIDGLTQEEGFLLSLKVRVIAYAFPCLDEDAAERVGAFLKRALSNTSSEKRCPFFPISFTRLRPFLIRHINSYNIKTQASFPSSSDIVIEKPDGEVNFTSTLSYHGLFRRNLKKIFREGIAAYCETQGMKSIWEQANLGRFCDSSICIWASEKTNRGGRKICISVTFIKKRVIVSARRFAL